ncbi:hypothetical protein ANANG_G00284610, partial [Anguilla anguilla]
TAAFAARTHLHGLRQVCSPGSSPRRRVLAAGRLRLPGPPALLVLQPLALLALLPHLHQGAHGVGQGAGLPHRHRLQQQPRAPLPAHQERPVLRRTLAGPPHGQPDRPSHGLRPGAGEQARLVPEAVRLPPLPAAAELRGDQPGLPGSARPPAGRHAAVLQVPRGRVRAPELLHRLHQVREVLHVQRGGGREDAPHHGEGGTGNGLEIMLDIQQDEYLPVWGETEETAFEAGVRVQIHSQAEPPFVHELGFGVAPGFQTFVATQEQRLTYLPPPWGECQSKAPDSGFFPVYSVTACRIDCETRYIVENCNCRMVHMPGDSPFCTPEQYKDCAEPALATLSEENNNCLCRTPCNTTRYNKELSMVKIPSKTSARYLEKKFNKSEKYISDNILVLDVFFEALNYETIEQKKAYEVAGLLGDIGGQMGLFIGASILTILEVFDYAYEVMKERLLELMCREDEEGSHGEDVSTCDPVGNHSEGISHTVSVPLQSTLGTLEEIAC